MPEWLMVLTSEHKHTTTDMDAQFNIHCQDFQARIHDMRIVSQYVCKCWCPYVWFKFPLQVFTPMKSSTNFVYECINAHPYKVWYK